MKEDGSLLFETSVGSVEFPAPVVYQQINGTRKTIAAAYRVRENNMLSFELGEYDVNAPMIIDPIALRWATWVNTASSGDNHGHCIWVDPSDGAIYMVARVVGTTDQITIGAFDELANGNLEMIVGKYLEPVNIGEAGTRVWQTYIGGNNDDNPYAMEQGRTATSTSPAIPAVRTFRCLAVPDSAVPASIIKAKAVTTFSF